MADSPHRCGCHAPPARWGGALTCHCSACGLTFSGIKVFDEHQAKGNCLSLRALAAKGVSEVRPGILGRPTPSQDPSKEHPGE